MEAVYNGQLVHFGVDFILYFDCCYSSLYVWCRILGVCKILEKQWKKTYIAGYLPIHCIMEA